MKKTLLRLGFLVASLLMAHTGAQAQTWTQGTEVAEGEFYLYNIGAGKFLNGGAPANGWGTHAWLTEGYGENVTLELSEGAYNISTPFTNGGDSHYLTAACWNDGNATPWTFTPVEGSEGHAYTISTGGVYLTGAADNTVSTAADASSNYAHWLVLTRQDLVAALTGASKDSRLNATFLITAPDFLRNDSRVNTAWQYSHNGGNARLVFIADRMSEWRSYFGNEFWNNTFDIHQTLTGLPAGTYRVSVQGFGTNGTTSIYGGSTSTAFTHTSSFGGDYPGALDEIGVNGANYENLSDEFTVGEDGTVTIGLKRERQVADDWTVFNNFRLYYYGLDLSAFQATLDAAVARGRAVEEGSVPSAAYDVLQAAITTHNKTYTTVAEYTAATQAITAATDAAKALADGYAEFMRVYNGVKAMQQVSVGDEAKAAADDVLAAQKAAVDTCTQTTSLQPTVSEAKSALRAAATAYIAAATLNDGSAYDANFYLDNPEPFAHADGWTVSVPPTFDPANRNAEFWNQSGASISQSLPQLPAGCYTLTAVALTRTGLTATLAAAGESMAIATATRNEANTRTMAGQWFDAGNGINNLDFCLDTPQEVTVSLTADNSPIDDYWMVWRNFSLTYQGPKATADELAALNGTINGAINAHTIGFEQGEYAPYRNVEGIKALADARAIDARMASSRTVKAVTARLEAATWTANEKEMNAVNDGTFATAAVSASGGEANAALQELGWSASSSLRWVLADAERYPSLSQTVDGRAVFVWPGTFQYGKTLGYTMPLKANTKYQVTLKYCSWMKGTSNNLTISVLDADGNGLAATPLGKVELGVDSANAFVSVRKVFTTGAAADYVLTLTADGNTTFADVVIVKAVAEDVTLSDEATEAPAANDYANVTYDRTLYSGWNSIVLPFDATLTELGAEKAYSFDGTVSVNGTDGSYMVQLASVTDGTLKANTPYIVKMTADKTGLTFNGKTVEPVAAPASAESNGFSFVGTYVAQPADNTLIRPNDYIVGEQGFVRALGGNEIRAFRAYLKNDGGAEAKGVTIDGEEVTGIESIAIRRAVTGKVYNLQGQQVSSPSHGIFIIDGKKVVRK